MVGRPGPFEIINDEVGGSVDSPIAPPLRRYHCPNYVNCLNLAAALNWYNFNCLGCSGEVDQTLVWRARGAMRKDRVGSVLCKLPPIHAVVNEREDLNNPDKQENKG